MERRQKISPFSEGGIQEGSENTARAQARGAIGDIARAPRWPRQTWLLGTTCVRLISLREQVSCQGPATQGSHSVPLRRPPGSQAEPERKALPPAVVITAVASMPGLGFLCIGPVPSTLHINTPSAFRHFDDTFLPPSSTF